MKAQPIVLMGGNAGYRRSFKVFISREPSHGTIAYIDGFNLYHGALQA